VLLQREEAVRLLAYIHQLEGPDWHTLAVMANEQKRTCWTWSGRSTRPSGCPRRA